MSEYHCAALGLGRWDLQTWECPAPICRVLQDWATFQRCMWRCVIMLHAAALQYPCSKWAPSFISQPAKDIIITHTPDNDRHTMWWMGSHNPSAEKVSITSGRRQVPQVTPYEGPGHHPGGRDVTPVLSIHRHTLTLDELQSRLRAASWECKWRNLLIIWLLCLSLLNSFSYRGLYSGGRIASKNKWKIDHISKLTSSFANLGIMLISCIMFLINQFWSM